MKPCVNVLLARNEQNYCVDSDSLYFPQCLDASTKAIALPGMTVSPSLS